MFLEGKAWQFWWRKLLIAVQLLEDVVQAALSTLVARADKSFLCYVYSFLHKYSCVEAAVNFSSYFTYTVRPVVESEPTTFGAKKKSPKTLT